MKLPRKDPTGRDDRELAPCLIFVDKDGNWFHKGTPMINERLIRLFYQVLDLDDQNRYILRLGGQTCLLEVEDTPFVVLESTFRPAAGHEQREKFVLRLIDGTREVLNPESLAVGRQNILYCKVRGGRFTARFSRNAYYQLAGHIREDPRRAGFVLPVNGIQYPIPTQNGQDIKD
jgi:hypothetical protein